MGIDDVIAALEAEGFTHDDDSKTGLEEFAQKREMHAGGDYVVHGVWKKGMCSVHIEQNTTTEVIDGLSTTTTHQPMVIISGPNGKSAAHANDVEAILNAITELS